MARLSVAILVLAGSALTLDAAAPTPAQPLDPATALERSEAAVGRTVGDIRLVDDKGRPIALQELRGRPLVVSLVYTSCSSVCPTTTQNLRVAVQRARAALGADAFQVITVGFDAQNDTPARMAAFARDQDIDSDPAWHLASGDGGTIATLLGDLGFSYQAVAGGFQHTTQTTILDAEGRVYRHVYGDVFPIPVFVEPLKELAFGTTTRSLSLSGLADRIRFLCTVYDPASGRYRTEYASAFGMVAGALSLLLTAWIIVRMWLKNRPLEARHG